MKRNLHSHTQFCDARNSMEEILQSAYEKGFTTWGFSPHGPISIESPCNMTVDSVTSYLQEIERLRSLFPEMKILVGMEVDFIDETHGPSSPEVKEYGLDYVIGSVHFIPNQKGEYHDIDGSPERFRKYLHDFFNDDLNYVVKTYWLQIQRMIRAGGFNIIGHIDKIALNASFINPEIEDSEEYKKLASETIEMAVKSGKAIEINTKHYGKYGRFFPNPRYWKRILSAGIEMPVNSDTHYAHLVEAGIKEANDLLSEMQSEVNHPDNL